MDIRMPEMDGLEATRRILAAPARRDCRIIILTTFDLDPYVYAALTGRPHRACWPRGAAS
jgi:CheY-like chemotaxis protein